MRFKLSRVLAAAFLAQLSVSVGSSQQMVVTPDHSNGVYHVGDTVHWSVIWKGDGDPPSARYAVLNGGLSRVGQGRLEFTHAAAALDTRFNAPGTLLVEVNWKSNDAERSESWAAP